MTMNSGIWRLREISSQSVTPHLVWSRPLLLDNNLSIVRGCVLCFVELVWRSLPNGCGDARQDSQILCLKVVLSASKPSMPLW